MASRLREAHIGLIRPALADQVGGCAVLFRCFRRRLRARVAEMPDEGEDWLQDIALDMEPGDGRLVAWEIGDQSTTAFAREGAEYLERLAKERQLWK